MRRNISLLMNSFVRFLLNIKKTIVFLIWHGVVKLQVKCCNLHAILIFKNEQYAIDLSMLTILWVAANWTESRLYWNVLKQTKFSRKTQILKIKMLAKLQIPMQIAMSYKILCMSKILNFIGIVRRNLSHGQTNNYEGKNNTIYLPTNLVLSI